MFVNYLAFVKTLIKDGKQAHMQPVHAAMQSKNDEIDEGYSGFEKLYKAQESLSYPADRAEAWGERVLYVNGCPLLQSDKAHPSSDQVAHGSSAAPTERWSMRGIAHYRGE